MKAAVAFVLGILISFAVATPVIQGKDTGKVKHHEGKVIVLNSGQFAYVVHLEIRKFVKLENPKGLKLSTSRCGGVIIKPDVVLTAAHCIGNGKPIIFAWAGIVDVKNEENKGQRIRVKAYQKHEYYVDGYSNKVFNPNDIAILWLEKSLKYDGRYIKQAILPRTKLNVENKRGWIVGWGITECGDVSDMLRKAVLRVMTKDKCKSYFKESQITENLLCIMSDKQNSIGSKGDSGGPFIVNGTVVGISSYSKKLIVKNKQGEDVVSCNPQKPSIYTDVSMYIDWIDEKLKNGLSPEKRFKKSH